MGGRYITNETKYICLADNGTFLAGGNACSKLEASSGGGGSEFYGGGGGADIGAGGGGSSWASKILKNVIYKNGNENIIEPDGSNNIGHSGNGFISIKPYVYCSLGINKPCLHFNILYTFVFILMEK
ncbi:hypothetical protein TVAG_489200 [Trichomonas vaginalis G3]|uniref:receptor protein-tyrosine kinase n=1 Tax=Trichomonas vaginalis (strain ATCC PRA-98 / G3) TaxID=412133 RepID=A2EVD0_TRIV3|nr:glycine-rich protein family [Trichomonas vaginalis G3]EAY03376.1 hypothetical protein TVAG_489200 [Trichomonas vaginalis G3]KAI5538094.1 glycine-rich protein family [Trichomonas vaginalis G3]|eukprot:XP_001315599.1 hypothetical protein [Trichomonas vaginalis G3]